MQARPTGTTSGARPRRPRQRASFAEGRIGRALPAPLRRWLAGEIGPVARALGAPPVLALLLLTIPLLVLIYQVPRVREIGLGPGDARLYLRGFGEVETAGDIPFRWMGDEALIRVPAAPGGEWDLRLRLASQRSTSAPPPAVEVYADDRLIARFPAAPEFQDYRFRFARPALPAEDLTIRIVSETFDPPAIEDDRQLGVALAGATLAPSRAGGWRPLLPPPGYAAVALLLIGGLAVALGRLEVPSRALAGALAVALGGLLAGQALRPDHTPAFLRALLETVPLLLIALVALRPIVRRLFAAGGVALGRREEHILLGIVLFGAAVHLAGMVFPTFRPHDLGFHANRVYDILQGRFLLTSMVSELAYRRTPYGPALYVLSAPIAAIAGDTSWPLRYLTPILDATAPILVCYLLRRCRLPEPAPLLAAFFTVLVPASHQLLWWGFFSNLFGQWTTLAVLTLVIGHWADLPKRGFFAATIFFLSLTLLSHPGTFVLTVALLPLLAIVLPWREGATRRSALYLLGAMALSLLIVFLLYYRHFTPLFVAQVRDTLAGTFRAPEGAETERGWEPRYIALRLFAFPFLLYFVTAIIVGVRLTIARMALGRAILAMLAVGVGFGIVHLTVGVWVRYFVFVSPALAIAAGIAVAWLLGRGRLGRVLAWGALAYCTVASLTFWFTITTTTARSPYP